MHLNRSKSISCLQNSSRCPRSLAGSTVLKTPGTQCTSVIVLFSAAITVLRSLGTTGAPRPRSHWLVRGGHLCVLTVLQKECAIPRVIFKLLGDQRVNTALLPGRDYLELVSLEGTKMTMTMLIQWVKKRE